MMKGLLALFGFTKEEEKEIEDTQVEIPEKDYPFDNKEIVLYDVHYKLAKGFYAGSDIYYTIIESHVKLEGIDRNAWPVYGTAFRQDFLEDYLTKEAKYQEHKTLYPSTVFLHSTDLMLTEILERLKRIEERQVSVMTLGVQKAEQPKPQPDPIPQMAKTKEPERKIVPKSKPNHPNRNNILAKSPRTNVNGYQSW